jgi:hypothetical protein
MSPNTSNVLYANFSGSKRTRTGMGGGSARLATALSFAFVVVFGACGSALRRAAPAVAVAVASRYFGDEMTPTTWSE